MSSGQKYIAEETRFKGAYSKSIYAILYQAYKVYFFRIIALIGIGFLGRILLLANTNIISWWVDVHSVPAPLQPVLFPMINRDKTILLSLCIAVTVVGFIFTAVYRTYFSRLSARAISKLYDEVTLRTSRLPLEFFDKQPVGRIVTRFSSDYGNVFRLFGGPLAEFFAIIFDLVGMLALIAFTNSYFMLLFFLILGLQFGIYFLNRENLRKERRALSLARSPSIAHYAETAQGATVVRTNSRVQMFFDRFQTLNIDYLLAKVSTTRYLIRFSLQMGACTALLLLLAGVVGFVLLEKGLVQFGQIGMMFAFTMLSASSVQMFFDWLAQFEEAMVGVERMSDYLLRDLEPGAYLPTTAEFRVNPKQKIRSLHAKSNSALVAEQLVQPQGIKVSKLHFRYGPKSNWILDDISFEIQAGERVGIVGKTGCGKSSLIQALFYLYPFEKGEISIGPYRVGPDTGVDLQSLRNSIGYISQDPMLFRGTLRENLDFNGKRSDDKIAKALDQVGLAEWLQFQKLGLDTVIEEKGRNLSAGEKQLVCMARCLLQECGVVIMDEATASIDPQTEEVLVKATDKIFSGKTQIIIAHRLSTIENCDRILWIEKGKIRAFDVPAKILQRLRVEMKGELVEIKN